MDYLGNILGNFTVKNDNNVNLFRVYFYEKGISFDDKFLRGIIESEDICKSFRIINSDWKNGNKDKDIVMEQIMTMLEENYEFLKDYFYNGEEKEVSNNQSTDNNYLYFQLLKKDNKLKPISRKEFESKIKDDKIGDYYVANFEEAKEHSEFYTYKTKEQKDCFIMVVDEKIKIGFTEKK